MIYLASQSPRRQTLLNQIGVEFHPICCEIDERPRPGEQSGDYVLRMAVEKAERGWKKIEQEQLPHHPVLAADTSIRLDNSILGKPESPEHALNMLTRLSGRKHQVLTSVAVILADRLETSVSITQVHMAALSDQQMQDYVATGEPMDKAGSYAIQGLGAVLVESIVGSYSGVMGLPLHNTSELLRGFGIPVWHNTHDT
ncbi:Maf family nucleotide pyrophosphatase [Endozoicomonas sp. Mp262]|uniref:Maf family protein n=1 Tax=Endozoicomonas sp. Mp262 TaxID=2919499 RepID=UPI0021D8CF5C